MSKQLEKLISKLGNPEHWEYTGICNDLGSARSKCICGHPIRYEFVITRDKPGSEAALGSDCIQEFLSGKQEALNKIIKDEDRLKELSRIVDSNQWLLKPLNQLKLTETQIWITEFRDSLRKGTKSANKLSETELRIIRNIIVKEWGLKALNSFNDKYFSNRVGTSTKTETK